jgi:hypothetical protein
MLFFRKVRKATIDSPYLKNKRYSPFLQAFFLMIRMGNFLRNLYFWGHPLKGPCQEEKFLLRKKNAFLVNTGHEVTDISTLAEISFGFRFQL